eukprot:TRINITY_DN73_c0_g2_i2.p2 TRINITY_DN73_c0_g2~~TRINITY_DN73_c0_g2_i2.p2  ORF type:complete len:146 (+),score=33.89 TRINITY_DN73_c0_g2_i2:37-438(+)
MSLAKATHSMIRVLDLDRSIKFYENAFGLKPAGRIELGDASLVFLRNEANDFEVELTWNKGRTEPYTHGEGYGHLAFVVEDVRSEHKRMKEAGYEVTDVKEIFRDDQLLGTIFFVKDPDGYKNELIQKQGRWM